ncbi:MAG: F0F1 ATP synthase subunit B [Candidatus Zixiibacteriota bacterium]
MGLEIGQIVTHIIGFLIAVFLLKRFAWKPLLSILEERRSKIKSEFDNIDKEKKKVGDLLSDYQAKLKEIDSLARVKIQEAAREGQKLANEIKETARKESKDILARAREEIQMDVDKAKVQLKNDLVTMTIRATEKLIREKLDEEKDKKLIAEFIDAVPARKEESST